MPTKTIKLVVFFFCFCSNPLLCSCQDSSLINFLVKRIAAQQVASDPYFFKGIYPSYISKNGRYNTKKKDNNVFYNCLVAYILHDTKAFLAPADQAITDSMLNSAHPFFARFRNKKRDTYNFWRTDSSFDFPFPTVFNLYSKNVSLPDDMDCTALALLALDANKATASTVHGLLQRFVNTDSNRVRSVISAYDTLPAYSTWLGIKFPVVFDVSVLCNVLTFVQTYDLPWTRADSASLELILTTIRHDYHISRPIYASPVYPKTSIILYHLARLMKIKKIPALEALKTKLITDAAKELSQTDNLVERIILSSSILKWGYTPPDIVLPAPNEIAKKIEQNNFSFFVANLPSYFKDFLKIAATKMQLGYYDYYCPAFNDALLLEYLVLKNNH